MAVLLSANSLSFRHTNGSTLFQNISFSATERLTAIVGHNGVGKSVLAQCLSGKLTPEEGSVRSCGLIHYVPQGWPGLPEESVTGIFGLTAAHKAAQRVEQGSLVTEDYVQAQSWWDATACLQQALCSASLPESLDTDREIQSFSGGEQFRLMWAAALFANPDLFIFDEPSNHLDTQSRARFSDWLQEESRPVIVISHDRQLLDQVDCIYELTATALHRHPGNFSDYRERQAARRKLQQRAVVEARSERKQRLRDEQAALEKQQQRVARGKATAERTGTDKMLRDAMKQSAENRQHNQRAMREQRRLSDALAVAQAEQSREWMDPIDIELPNSALPDQKIVLTLDRFSSGVTTANHPPVDAVLQGAFRLHVEGCNGSGKSVLLHTLLGRITPIAGRSQVHVPVAMLDQQFFHVDAESSAIEYFIQQQPELSEHEVRARLAKLQLRNHKAELPFGQLSGGEKLKAVLATHLLGATTPQLLLLDEPTNHLDLNSLAALEEAMSAYQGALIVVSHDRRFVESLAVSHRLALPTIALVILPTKNKHENQVW